MRGAVQSALRALGRDWRAGRLRIVSLALVLAVAAVTSVNAFTDRIVRGMERYGAELIGADLVLESSAEPSRNVVQQAHELGLETALTVEFPSVVLAGDETALVQVKAVSEGYLLRGRLRVSAHRGDSEREITGIPDDGEVWVEPRLLDRLNLEVGDILSLGDRSFRVKQSLEFEPDRGGQLFQLAPRVLMSWADLESTGLVTPQSRVRYRLLMAGDPGRVARFADWLEVHLEGPGKVRTAEDMRPELRAIMDRAHRFLALAALVAVLVSGAAIAVGVRHYVTTELDASALLRCLGASQSLILTQHLVQFLILGLVAGLFGCLVGYLAQFVLAHLFEGWFLAELPALGLAPLGFGLATGLILVLGFTLPPLVQLARVPPLRVLRRQLGAASFGSWFTALVAAMTFGGLAFWQMNGTAWGARLVLGAGAGVVILGGMAWVMMAILGWCLPAFRGVSWLGLARVVRRKSASVIQITSLALGVATLLLLAVTRSDVLERWYSTLPPDAPNRFLINIQADERAALTALLAKYGIDNPNYFPMVRGRLMAINGDAVDPDAYEDSRAQRLASREFNLSWTEGLKEDNKIIAGAWWDADAENQRAFSVETGIARDLGIRLGDRLEFRVAGSPIEAQVTSLREVEWDSFRPNFFVIATPPLLRDEPSTWITALNLPDDTKGLQTALARTLPSVTVINVEALLNRIRTMMERAALAVEFVFAFTLVAGVVVMFAAIQADRGERQREIARLRVFGARRGQVRISLLAEFVAIGLVSGTLAALISSVAGYLVETHVLDLPFRFNPAVWYWGLGGGVGIGLLGFWGTRGILDRPPTEALKAL